MFHTAPHASLLLRQQARAKTPTLALPSTIIPRFAALRTRERREDFGSDGEAEPVLRQLSATCWK
ncbi:hypothetical protein EYF80_000282 [Liparis tanakae]|uniref:Uncharacterized protein n=1 Tax=Liparis tanakae TaxID=230148 RepID=A0A4Z2JH90_9TELE|nr:hypothetical protein EYF80_000282 [Liparis tanakae]